MNIDIDSQIMQQLEALARRQHRDINELVQEALAGYLAEKVQKDAELREEIRQIFKEHEWLMNELAKK